MVAKIYLDESTNLIDIEIKIFDENLMVYYDVFIINKRDVLKNAIDALNEINNVLSKYHNFENILFIERKPNIKILGQTITELICYN